MQIELNDDDTRFAERFDLLLRTVNDQARILTEPKAEALLLFGAGHQ